MIIGLRDPRRPSGVTATLLVIERTVISSVSFRRMSSSRHTVRTGSLGRLWRQRSACLLKSRFPPLHVETTVLSRLGYRPRRFLPCYLPVSDSRADVGHFSNVLASGR